MGKNHPGLFRKDLKIKSHSIHWIRKDKSIQTGEEKKYLVRIRYRQRLQEAILKMRKNYLYIIFKTHQRGISKGQFAAWYKKNELIGSGPIN